MPTSTLQVALAIARGEADEPVTRVHLCALYEALNQAERELAEAHIKEVLAATALATLLVRCNEGHSFVFREGVGKEPREVVIQRIRDGQMSSVEVRLEPHRSGKRE